MIRGGLVTLFVRDVPRAVRFYVETLGMKLVEEEGRGWAVLDAGNGFRIGLTTASSPAEGEGESEGAFAPSVGLYSKVPIREAVAIFANRGLTFELKEDGANTLAHFRDPDGNRLSLCEERRSTNEA